MQNIYSLLNILRINIIIDNKFSKNGIYYLLSLRLIPTISFVLIKLDEKLKK